MKILFSFFILLIGGCASNSGVVPIGQDTFLMSKQAATGFSGLGTLKTDLLIDANTYCVSEGKKFQIVSTNENSGPYILGNFPRAEIQFMCLESGDREIQRPKLRQNANTVIEIR